jgi:hypothetical protein
VSFVLDSDQGQRADVPRKILITDPGVLRFRAMAYYRQRLDGMTDSEIGRLWGKSRQCINGWINALTPDQKAQVRRERLRAIRADSLLKEEEMEYAGQG